MQGGYSMENYGKQLEAVIKRLDILILLNLEKTNDLSPTSMADKISKLSNYGISAAEIANIIGKQTNYVTATLSQKKVKGK
jgi:hypothetical protein